MAYSAAFRWTLRVIVWGVGIAVMIPAYKIGSTLGTVMTIEECIGNRTGTKNGLFEAQQLSLCMFLRSNYLESRRLEPVLRDVMALKAAPCERTGIWKSARRQSVYRVTLGDDNRFRAEPLSEVAPTPMSGEASGYWGETGGKLVWIYDHGVIWPPDINRIEDESTDRFTLVEVNGARTEFTRERRLESARCPIPSV